MAAVEQALEGVDSPLAVVSHGNLMTLLLRHFDNRFGFETWRALTNPDVLEVTELDGAPTVTRVWSS